MHKVYPNLRNLALYFLNSFTPFFRFFLFQMTPVSLWMSRCENRLTARYSFKSEVTLIEGINAKAGHVCRDRQTRPNRPKP